MRKLFAIILFALLLGVGVVALIETDPGYVLVSYGAYTLETSLWVGMLLLLALVLLVFYGLRLVYRLLSGQRSLVSWFGNRATTQARRQTVRGLVSYVEGHWLKATRQLERAAQHNDLPVANYLLAAKASGKLGDTDKVHEFLRAAGDADESAAAAVDITLARMLLEEGEAEKALATLECSSAGAANHPTALLLMNSAYASLDDPEGQLRLLPALRKHKALDEAGLEALEGEIHRARLAAAPNQKVKDAWQEMPQRLRHEPALILQYVRRLLAMDDNSEAEKQLQKALKHQWQDVLVNEYGLVAGPDSSRQLSLAESWLAAHSEDKTLLLALGRLAARDKLWGKARDYYESSYRIEASAEVCAELGRLLTDLGEPKVAAAYFREGLLLAEEDLPELPRPEQHLSQSQRMARS